MFQVNNDIEVNGITARNPQAISILERVHQRIVNIICIFKVQDMALNDENPWDRILASTMFAMCAVAQITM